MFKTKVRSERGATAVEYSVLVFLIATVIVISVASLGSATSSGLDCTGKSWQNKTASCSAGASTGGSGGPSTSTPSPSPTSSTGSGGNNGNGNGGVGQGNGQGSSRH